MNADKELLYNKRVFGHIRGLILEKYGDKKTITEQHKKYDEAVKEFLSTMDLSPELLGFVAYRVKVDHKEIDAYHADEAKKLLSDSEIDFAVLKKTRKIVNPPKPGIVTVRPYHVYPQLYTGIAKLCWNTVLHPNHLKNRIVTVIAKPYAKHNIFTIEYNTDSTCELPREVRLNAAFIDKNGNLASWFARQLPWQVFAKPTIIVPPKKRKQVQFVDHKTPPKKMALSFLIDNNDSETDEIDD
jgi:hypothetical protein